MTFYIEQEVVLLLISTFFSIASTILTLKSNKMLKTLETAAAYQTALLEVHYSEKLSCVKSFLSSAAEFIANPESDEYYLKMVSTAGCAIYVSNADSMKTIEDFLAYAQQLRSKQNNLVDPIYYYSNMCIVLGQESIALGEMHPQSKE